MPSKGPSGWPYRAPAAGRGSRSGPLPCQGRGRSTKTTTKPITRDHLRSMRINDLSSAWGQFGVSQRERFQCLPQPPLLWGLERLPLGLGRWCRRGADELCHSLLHRHPFQYPDGTPPFGVTLALLDAARSNFLVLPELSAGQDDPDASGTRLHAGDLTVPPPQTPVVTVLHPASRPGRNHESGIGAGWEHAGQDTPGRLTHCDEASAGRGSGAPGLSGQWPRVRQV